MIMEYLLATEKETEQIVALVQDTIKCIYPKYYLNEVVDFFCGFIVMRIYPRISKVEVLDYS